MSALTSHTGGERGQVIVFVVAILTVLLGFAALVLDVGSWFRTHRHLQTSADAAALAGVQDLPASSATAASVANSYAQQNYTGLTPTVTFPGSAANPACSNTVSSCIRVVAAKTAAGAFARVYGAAFNSVTISARAMAAVTTPSVLKNVAPIAVKNTVACASTSPSCFGTQRTFTFDESNVSSSTIGLINLTCHSTASTACGSSAGIGGSQLKDWIEVGYPDALPAGQWYGVKTGETVGPVKQGLTDKINTPLFFPVFDSVTNSGSNYFFHIVGWAVFVITSVDSWGPGGRQLTGHFVTYTATDLPAGLPLGSSTDFGVHVLSLVE
ncbi:MAG: pilus assembly protein TadG-related protein [Gaiellaceae bacterium]